MKPPRRPVEKWPLIWPAVVLVLLGLVAVLLVALHATSTADAAKRANDNTIQRQRARIACVNQSLAARQRYIDADHHAEVAKVSGQVRGLLELRRDPEAGVLQFTRASERYLATIARIDREQKKHPLGAC